MHDGIPRAGKIARLHSKVPTSDVGAVQDLAEMCEWIG
jgi:hypothetical protein